MSSTTYHFANTGKLYAIRKHFVDINKMANNNNTHFLRTVTAMARNAGQLPQPFWLGAARGGGSCGAATCAARA